MTTSLEPIVPLSPDASPLKMFQLSLHPQDSINQRRLFVRRYLKELLEQHGIATTSDLLDLGHRPVHPSIHISISHCEDTAVLGWCPRPHLVGVDVETLSRLSPPAIARVTTPYEQEIAPKPEMLWSAKESAFKAHSDTVKLVSSVEIIDWVSLSPDVWRFKTRSAQSKESLAGFGEIRLTMKHSMCFFLGTHQL